MAIKRFLAHSELIAVTRWSLWHLGKLPPTLWKCVPHTGLSQKSRSEDPCLTGQMPQAWPLARSRWVRPCIYLPPLIQCLPSHRTLKALGFKVCTSHMLRWPEVLKAKSTLWSQHESLPEENVRCAPSPCPPRGISTIFTATKLVTWFKKKKKKKEQASVLFCQHNASRLWDVLVVLKS